MQEIPDKKEVYPIIDETYHPKRAEQPRIATESHGSDTRHGWQRLENKPNDMNGE